MKFSRRTLLISEVLIELQETVGLNNSNCEPLFLIEWLVYISANYRLLCIWLYSFLNSFLLLELLLRSIIDWRVRYSRKSTNHGASSTVQYRAANHQINPFGIVNSTGNRLPRWLQYQREHIAAVWNSEPDRPRDIVNSPTFTVIPSISNCQFARIIYADKNELKTWMSFKRWKILSYSLGMFF